MGRRENTASQTPHTDGFRYENAASPHSSFRAKARNLFRSRQGKGCERNGKRETPCSLRPEKRCFMQTAPYRKRNTANEKDPSAPLGMTIRECRFARIRHFERKREIFFVRGKAKAVRGTASGKHPAPCAPEERCFMQTDSRMKQKMANEKDPSAPLGMTIRETAFLIFPFIPRREPTSAPSGHLLPREGGRIPLHRLHMKMAFDTKMPLPRIRHFERKREIFFVRGQERM